MENKTTGSQKKPNKARQGLGRTGERLVAEALPARGYRVLERNFRCVYGEIDLIAEDDQNLVFIEVKTRRGDTHGLPEEAVTRQKQRKLIQVANYYLDLHSFLDRAWRIDVVAVQMGRRGELIELRFHENAVTEQ